MRTPYAELSAIASVEAHRKNIYRPAYYVHKWWARRTGSVFRGLTLDLLLPPGEDVMAAYYRRHAFSDVIVLDPFMGGGTGVGEALRLGCKVVGCDLNPVSWFLVRSAMQDVDVPALMQAFREIEADVAERVGALYATTCEGCGGEARAQYILWVKQVPCASCGASAELNLSNVAMMSMQTRGTGLCICPSCEHPFLSSAIDAEVSCPSCDARFVPIGRRSRNTHYHCDRCGHGGPILAAIGDASEPPAHRMKMLVTWCDICGKRFQRPSERDHKLYHETESDVARRLGEMRVPKQEIPEGYNTNQVRRYGYRHWHQLFNARQLRGLDLLFSEIDRLADEPAREQLLLLASACLEFNSMLCGAKGLGTGAVRHVFAHHAFIPPKQPLEANLWGVHRSSGGFATLFRERLLRAREWASAPVERRFTGSKAEKVPIHGERLRARLAGKFEDLRADAADLLVLNQSSERLHQIPDGSVDFIITDPPYADNVMYSELSDYFYVWLREYLRSKYPNFQPPLVEDEREAVLNPGRGRDDAHYTALLAAVFSEATRKLKPGGRFAFTFHHSGEDGWRSVLQAIVESGLVVERWWPVMAEMTSGVPIQGKAGNNGHIDVVFVCGRASEVAAPIEHESVEVLGRRLAAVVKLVAADHRALLKANEVQEASWRAASSESAAA